MTPLQKLAAVLAKNYFDTSQTRFDNAPGRHLTSEVKRELPRMGQQVFKDADAGEIAMRLPERTVLVVGTGASFGAFGDAYPGTPAAVKAITSILSPPPARKVGGAKKGGQNNAGAADADTGFEAELNRLATAHGNDAVRNALVQIYGERHHPHLGFEIIAHLFKHRFIDVIINFNFDELLDEVIEGEMGTAEYHHVIFEGQCRGLAPLLVDQRLKIPLYIKPYGTVSHPSSIRFAQEPPLELPQAMNSLITRIIGGHWKDDPTNVTGYTPYRVNLITVGFSMQSVHLLEILENVNRVNREEKNAGMAIYHLNRGDQLEDLKKSSAIRSWADVKEEFIDVGDYGDLAKTIRTLWEETSGHFQEPFQPRGVARHEIVHNLFFSVRPDGTAGDRIPARDRDGKTGNLNYFLARLYAEVAMAIARGNGQIDLGTMSESRVGRMFELLRGCHGSADLSMYDILRKFCSGGTVEFFGRDNSVFRFRYDEADNARDLNENLARELWKRLIEALEGIPDEVFQDRLGVLRSNEDRNDKMIRRFRQLASSDAQDVSPTFRPRHLLLSRQPRPNHVIHTSLGLSLRFVEMLNEPWDLMLAMTENGKVMSKYQRHLDYGSVQHSPEGKQFCLILARNDHPEVAEGRLARYYDAMLRLPPGAAGEMQPGDPPLFHIPAWAHNQHMVLLLRREGGEYRPKSAIRYETPRLGNRVNPVFIRNESDLEAALECFKRYLQMSVRGIPTRADDTDEEESKQRAEANVLWALLTARGRDRRQAEATWALLNPPRDTPIAPPPPEEPPARPRRKIPFIG